MTAARRIRLSALAAVTWAGMVAAVPAQPLVTGDLTIYYDFDSFTDAVMDGSGNGFNGNVRDATRTMLDNGSTLSTTGTISNDTSNAKRGAGAIRFNQSAILGEGPVFLDMDGSVIKANAPTKVPKAAVTVATWLKLPEINLAIDPVSDNGDWNAPASILTTGTSGSGGPPAFGTHFHAEGDGRIRLGLRGETMPQNIVNSGGAPYSGHPFPNQPDIDASGAAPQSWPLNEWFHVAYSYDKNASGGAGEFAMYYNGRKIRGGPPNGTTSGVPTGPIDLGAWDLRAAGDIYDGLGIGAVLDNGRRRLHGWMDEFYIFTRALSEAEIATLAVSAAPSVSGDYNNNGVVDAADYVLWRAGGPLMNEVHNPGTVTQEDYDQWRARFGNSSSGGQVGGSALMAVPEPTSLLVATLATGLVLAGFGRFVHRRNCLQ